MAAFFFFQCLYRKSELKSLVSSQLPRGLGPSHRRRGGEVRGGENQRRGRQRVALAPRTLPGSSGADAQAAGAGLPRGKHAGWDVSPPQHRRLRARRALSNRVWRFSVDLHQANRWSWWCSFSQSSETNPAASPTWSFTSTCSLPTSTCRWDGAREALCTGWCFLKLKRLTGFFSLLSRPPVRQSPERSRAARGAGRRGLRLPGRHQRAPEAPVRVSAEPSARPAPLPGRGRENASHRGAQSALSARAEVR